MTALPNALREIEEYAHGFGWDGPVRVFALVSSSSLEGSLPGWSDDGAELTAVEQDDLPDAESVEELLVRLAWPESVDGCALTVEHVIVQRDDETVIGPAEALADPDRRDVRLAVGVLRDGSSWCVVRVAGVDEIIESADAVPELIRLLSATFH